MAQKRVRKDGAPSGSQDPGDAAHDILAAEEFGMGTPDPRLHVEPAHDVLAAEEFAVGDYDPVLHHHGPVGLPGDPTGIAEPHDVLAAEEFAMPAPRGRAPIEVERGPERPGWNRRLMLIGGLALLVALRRRRR